MGAHGQLCEFRPFSSITDAHYGIRSDLAQREAPGDGIASIRQFHLAFQPTPVVEGSHPVGPGFIVERNQSQRL